MDKHTHAEEMYVHDNKEWQLNILCLMCLLQKPMLFTVALNLTMLYSIQSSELIVPCVSIISHHALQKPFDYKVKKCFNLD